MYILEKESDNWIEDFITLMKERDLAKQYATEKAEILKRLILNGPPEKVARINETTNIRMKSGWDNREVYISTS